MRLGNRIHELRTSLGLSQGVLAEKLGVSRQAISKWENDSAVPEPEKLLMIAEVFQVTLDQLVEDGTPSTDAASAPAVSGFTMTSVSTDQLAGGLLIGISLVGILWQKAHIYTSMLWIFIPVVLCGLLCLRIRGRAQLWCCWAVYLMLDASIFYQDWTHWWSLFERHRGMFRFEYFNINPWIQFAGIFAILAVTIWHFRRNPMRISTRLRQQAAVGSCICFAIISFIMWFQPDFRDILSQFWACIAGLSMALVFTRVQEPTAGTVQRTLGERISFLRTEKRISQDELAARLDVSRQAVSKWETGKAIPTLEKLTAISRQFGVSLEWLLRDGQSAAPATMFLSAGQMVGMGLVLWSVYVMFRWLDQDVDLLFSLPLLWGGTMCLFWPRRTGLWGTWTAVLLADAVLRQEFSTGSRLPFLYLLKSVKDGVMSYQLRYLDYEFYLVEIAVQIILLLLTFYSFRQTVLPPKGRTRWLLAGGWLLWIVLESCICFLVYPRTGPRLKSRFHNHVIFRIFVDHMSLILLAAVVVITAAAIRGHRSCSSCTDPRKQHIKSNQ